MADAAPLHTTLHMIRARLDGRRLFELARRRRLLPEQGETDLGYAVHSLLGELFGELAPKPFALPDDTPAPAGLTVLGYSAHDAARLKEHADLFADPFVHAAVDWAWFDAKPLPAAFPAGRTLGFEVRACPVERSRLLRGDRTESPEVDALIVEGTRQGIERGLDRNAVYLGWLERELARRGGVRLLSADVTGFRYTRFLRRDQKTRAPSRLPALPDARFKGVLEVTDAGAFAALLARGVGRHRAFGFGMLLLRPA
jgi:CRISPR system Cascade subunit CasE